MSIFEREDLKNNFDKVIKSVFNNSALPELFHIIIDGPVSLEFKKKIMSICNKNQKIKTYWLKKNIGEAKALNKIIPKIKTQWLAKVDGDDYNYKNRFKEQIKYIKQGYDLIGSYIIEKKNNKMVLKKKVPINFKKIKFYAKFRNPINHMTVMFKKSAFIKVGGYPNIYLKEDYGLWANFIKHNYKIININKYLVVASVGEGFYIRRGGWKYIKSEINLQIHLIRCNINGFFWGAIILFLRCIALSVNPNLRSMIYKMFLRH